MGARTLTPIDRAAPVRCATKRRSRNYSIGYFSNASFIDHLTHVGWVVAIVAFQHVDHYMRRAPSRVKERAAQIQKVSSAA
jgi:hypothetical protein